MSWEESNTGRRKGEGGGGGEIVKTFDFISPNQNNTLKVRNVVQQDTLLEVITSVLHYC